MALCNITGTVYLPNGEVAARRNIAFTKLASDTVTADYLGAVLPEVINTRTDANGEIDVSLITGNYMGIMRGIRGGLYHFTATVPDALTADFTDIIADAPPVIPVPAWLQQALQARDDAVAAAVAAEGDADRAEDAADRAELFGVRQVASAAAFFALTSLEVGVRYSSQDGSGAWDVLASGTGDFVQAGRQVRIVSEPYTQATSAPTPQVVIDAATSSEGSPWGRMAVDFSRSDLRSVAETIEVITNAVALDGLTAQWDGAGIGDLVAFENCEAGGIQDFTLLGRPTATPNAAIKLRSPNLALSKNEHILIRRGVIGRRATADTPGGGSADPTNRFAFQYGIQIGGDGFDGNNDKFYIEDVRIHSALTAALGIMDTQSIWGEVRSCLFNDSEIGIYQGANFTGYNLQFNRCRTADIRGIRATEIWINGMQSENSAVFWHSTAGASLYLTGGRLLKNTATKGYFFRNEGGGSLVVRNIRMQNQQGPGDVIEMRSGSAFPSTFSFKDCRIDGGALRDTWLFDSGIFPQPWLVDIEHFGMSFKTTRPYSDKPVTLPTVAASLADSFTSGGAYNPEGAIWLLSVSQYMPSCHVTGGSLADTVLRGRIYNKGVTASAALPVRARWCCADDYVTYKGASAVTPVLMANNAQQTFVIPVAGARKGDFSSIGYGRVNGWSLSTITSCVSNDNEVTVVMYNNSGGNSLPSPTTLYAGVIGREGVAATGTAVYTPTAIAAGADVSINVTVNGAQIGAHALHSYSQSLMGLTVTAQDSAANTVTILITNGTAAPITLAPGYFMAGVLF